MVDGKKIRPTKCVPSALALFILLCLPNCFGVVNIYFQGQFILDPAGHLFQRPSTQWDLSLHMGVFTKATQMKRPPSSPRLPPPFFLSLLPTPSLD